MVEENDYKGYRRAVLVFVNRRDAKTLERVIARHIGHNVTVHHDGLKSYGQIDWARLNVDHREHVHANRQRTLWRSQYIEGYWGALKDHIEARYRTIPATDKF
jgi:hypothetical protein